MAYSALSIAVSYPPVAVSDATIAVSGPPIAHSGSAISISSATIALSDAPVAISDTAIAISDAPILLSDRPIAISDAFLNNCSLLLRDSTCYWKYWITSFILLLCYWIFLLCWYEGNNLYIRNAMWGQP